MPSYVIFTDGPCDLPESYCKEHDLTVVPLYCTLSSGETVQYPAKDDFDMKGYYDALRGGVTTKTAAPGMEDFKKRMAPVLQSGRDILYLGFSAKLSGSYNVGRLAAQELMEEFPGRKVLCVNTKAASLGEGLLVTLVVEKRAAGATIEEACAYAEEMVPKIRHWFTVDNLMHLKRGGRISAGTAIFGTMLQIKPLLKVNEEGGLESFDKVRGRRAALKQLADFIGENMVPDTLVAISHGDCEEDALFVRDILRRKYNVKQIMMNYVDPIVGGHSGPGTVAAFCVDKNL